MQSPAHHARQPPLVSADLHLAQEVQKLLQLDFGMSRAQDAGSSFQIKPSLQGLPGLKLANRNTEGRTQALISLQ